MALVGTEPATFRFVTQHLNYCATAVPQSRFYITEKIRIFVQNYCVYGNEMLLSSALEKFRNLTHVFRIFSFSY